MHACMLTADTPTSFMSCPFKKLGRSASKLVLEQYIVDSVLSANEVTLEVGASPESTMVPYTQQTMTSGLSSHLLQ